jgi:hypothetical protein
LAEGQGSAHAADALSNPRSTAANGAAVAPGASLSPCLLVCYYPLKELAKMMIAAAISTGQLFEGLMLVCFGTSWPFAIWKTYRTKRVEGKSMIFLVLVTLGYLSGLTAKFYRAATEHKPLEPVTALYGVLALMVAADLALVIRYRRNPAPMSTLPPHE